MDYNQNNQYGNYPPPGAMPQQPLNGYYPGYNGSYNQNQYNMNQYNTNPYYNRPAQNYNMPYGNAPSYPYGIKNNQENYEMAQRRYIKLREQKQEIRKYSTATAVAMLAFLLASTVISFILTGFNLMDLYKANGTFASCVGVLYSFAAMGLPFLLAKKAMAKPGEDHTVSYFAPKLNLKTVSIIAASVFGCLTAMIVTGYLASFFEGMGFTFSAGETPVVNNVYDIIAMFLGTALVPPLVEEFAMRNVVMQPLRKYGNLFAIVMSAVVFGIFHGTPTQIPFATLSGLFIGYAVIATNSIWSGVIIHAIINSISCAYHTCLYFTDEDTADKAYEIGCIVLVTIGLIGLIIYLMKYRTEFKEILSHKGLEEYSFKEKTVKFLVTPVMIIAIIVFIIQAITLISYNSGVFV